MTKDLADVFPGTTLFRKMMRPLLIERFEIDAIRSATAQPHSIDDQTARVVLTPEIEGRDNLQCLRVVKCDRISTTPPVRDDF